MQDLYGDHAACESDVELDTTQVAVFCKLHLYPNNGQGRRWYADEASLHACVLLFYTCDRTT